MAEQIILTEKGLALYKHLHGDHASRSDTGKLVQSDNWRAFEELRRKGVAKNVGKGAGHPTMAKLIVPDERVSKTPRKSAGKSLEPLRPGVNMKAAVKPEDLRKIADDFEREAESVRKELTAERQRQADELWEKVQSAAQARDAKQLGMFGSQMAEKLGVPPSDAEIRAEVLKRLNKKVYTGGMRRVLNILKE